LSNAVDEGKKIDSSLDKVELAIAKSIESGGEVAAWEELVNDQMLLLRRFLDLALILNACRMLWFVCLLELRVAVYHDLRNHNPLPHNPLPPPLPTRFFSPTPVDKLCFPLQL